MHLNPEISPLTTVGNYIGAATAYVIILTMIGFAIAEVVLRILVDIGCPCSQIISFRPRIGDAIHSGLGSGLCDQRPGWRARSAHPCPMTGVCAIPVPRRGAPTVRRLFNGLDDGREMAVCVGLTRGYRPPPAAVLAAGLGNFRRGAARRGRPRDRRTTGKLARAYFGGLASGCCRRLRANSSSDPRT